MSAGHEEFEAGHEFDRAIRAAVTGLSQIMERYARLRHDQSRESAARAREEWMGHRDAARHQYLPWTQEGRIEKLPPAIAAEKWAAAAAWSDLDPTARQCANELATRITRAHGQHPSALLRRAGQEADRAAGPADVDEAQRLLSMNEAYGLAVTQAPSWYSIPAEMKPLEVDRPPANAAEEAFHADWQYYFESGQLPEVSQWERWADHVGRSDEFTPDKWSTSDGLVDEDAREAALARVWDEGREDRVAIDLADHDAAMHTAGMGGLDDQVPGLVGPPGQEESADAVAASDSTRNEPPRSDSATAGQGTGRQAPVTPATPPPTTRAGSWQGLLTPSRFDAATAQQASEAWRTAAAAGVAGNLGAQKAAERLATMLRERRGVNPDALLIDALTDQAARNTEARRSAEDRARRNEAVVRESRSTPPAPGTAAAAPPAAAATAETVTRARVIELNEMTADYYASNLRPGSPGHRYMAGRLGPEFERGGWTLGETRPGWQNLTNHLRSRGVSDEEMIAAGLAEPGKFGVRDIFRDRVMMGVRDHETGELVGFLGRDLSGDPRAPKVRNTATTPAFRKGDHVFGLREAQPGAQLVRVEGPFDALAVSLASDGRAAGVSTMGTAMTDTQTTAIAERAGDRVWLALDVDEGGMKATQADYLKLSEKGIDVRQVDVPGKDPADVWEKQPASLTMSLSNLEQSRPAADAVVEHYLTLEDATAEGFSDLMEQIRPYSTPVDMELHYWRWDQLEDAREQRRRAEQSEAGSRAEVNAAEADVASTPGPSANSPDRPAEERPERAQVDDGLLVDQVDEQHQPAPEDQAAEAGTEHRLAAADEKLRTDQAVTDSAESVEARAYDRRNEALRTEMSEPAGTARDASSHGFSQSTQDQVHNATPGRKGAAAKVQRGGGVKQTRGRTLRR